MNRRHGAGTSYYPAGGAEYTGRWRRGTRHGAGRLTFPDSGGSYEGSFRDGKMAGEGTYHHANGDRFEGQFEFDSPDGFGRRPETRFLDGRRAPVEGRRAVQS